MHYELQALKRVLLVLGRSSRVMPKQKYSAKVLILDVLLIYFVIRLLMPKTVRQLTQSAGTCRYQKDEER